MDQLHKHAIPALFITAAGFNALAGLELLLNPLPKDYSKTLAQIHGGDETKNKH